MTTQQRASSRPWATRATIGFFLATGGLAGGCADDLVLRHGVVKMQFRRSAAEEETPFTGTKQVVATFEYNTCIRDFYESHPSYEYDGVDGAPVFGGLDLGGEGWRDRMCEEEPGYIECEVNSFEQRDARLLVTYDILDDGMEGRILRFGPLPTRDLVSGCTPVVSQVAEAQVFGTDEQNRRLWTAVSVNPMIAETNQGAEMNVQAARDD